MSTQMLANVTIFQRDHEGNGHLVAVISQGDAQAGFESVAYGSGAWVAGPQGAPRSVADALSLLLLKTHARIHEEMTR